MLMGTLLSGSLGCGFLRRHHLLFIPVYSVPGTVTFKLCSLEPWGALDILQLLDLAYFFSNIYSLTHKKIHIYLYMAERKISYVMREKIL